MFDRFKRKTQEQTLKTPQQIVAEGDKKRAQGEGLRDGERQAYNKAQNMPGTMEFEEREVRIDRVVDRQVAEAEKRKKEAREKIQKRIKELEELVVAKQAWIDQSKKEIIGFNRSWSSTNDLQERSSLSLSIKIKEQLLLSYQEELDKYSRELEKQKLEMQKL